MRTVRNGRHATSFPGEFCVRSQHRPSGEQPLWLRPYGVTTLAEIADLQAVREPMSNSADAGQEVDSDRDSLWSASFLGYLAMGFLTAVNDSIFRWLIFPIA